MMMRRTKAAATIPDMTNRGQFHETDSIADGWLASILGTFQCLLDDRMKITNSGTIAEQWNIIIS